MNDANLSQGESERSERSQIEDVTNYCSNVAQGSVRTCIIDEEAVPGEHTAGDENTVIVQLKGR